MTLVPKKKTKSELEKELRDLEELVKYKEGLPHIFGQKFYPWARRVWDSSNREIFVVSANQVGKMIQCVTEIPTPAGFRKMGDLKIGDEVFGENGKPCQITAIPFEGEDQGFRVIFDDGTDLIAGANHLWLCKTYEERFRKVSKRYNQWITLSSREIYERCKYTPKTEATLRAIIPYTPPVDYPAKDLFDPYALGLILGDGCTVDSSFTVTKNDEEVLDYFVTRYKGVRTQKKEKLEFSGKGLGVRFSKPEGFPSSLVGLRSWEKFIPNEYMTASIEQRLNVLRGLMDTDGWVREKGDITEFNSSSEKMASQLAELVFSLGGSCKQSVRLEPKYQGGIGRPSYRVRIKMPPDLNPFKLKRKADRWRGDIRYKHERVIREMHPLGTISGRCITVNSPENCFLAGRNYVVTHNSSLAIRKNIRLATDPTLWPKFWPNLPKGQAPNLFWYFYPTLPVANTEFETKWEPLFLPRGEFKNHPQFGWEAFYEKGLISKIRFNTGVQLQMKSYSMKVKDLQSSSVYHCTFDEELPVEYLPEIASRRNSTDGLLLGVFTATTGQLHWKQTMEPSTKSEEKHPDALKIQVSLYDSQFFDDGTPSHWTKEKINRAIANCPTEAEIQRRVYGRFVKSAGLIYEAFTIGKNMCDHHPLPKSWSIWSGVDVGSGGQSGHPAAIIFIGVSPDFKQGRVFRAWRGDGIPTTASDILEKYRELRQNLTVTNQSYDFAAADFFTIASRMGEGFSPANKKREAGIVLLNTLFKTGMLKIMRNDPELEKLVQELCSVSVTDNKRKTLDDLSDALRYAAMAIPWSYEGLESLTSVQSELDREKRPVKIKTETEMRREWMLHEEEQALDDIEAEFDFWNDLSGA